jgi:hypothetical protein
VSAIRCAKARGSSLPVLKFTAETDSALEALEGAGFEPSVPGYGGFGDIAAPSAAIRPGLLLRPAEDLAQHWRERPGGGCTSLVVRVHLVAPIIFAPSAAKPYFFRMSSGISSRRIVSICHWAGTPSELSSNSRSPPNRDLGRPIGHVLWGVRFIFNCGRMAGSG